MVEGPGATRNGRKVQIAVGKTSIDNPKVNDVESSHKLFSSLETTLAAPLPPFHFPRELSSRTLTEAFTVGKELFLIFSACREASSAHESKEVALRLHFGMNGSLNTSKFNSKHTQNKTSGVARWKQKKSPSLRLCFVDEWYGSSFSDYSEYTILEAWETTVTYLASAAIARDKLLNLRSRDA